MLGGMKNPSRYTRTAIAIHWLVAALIIAMLCMGLWMEGLPNDMFKFEVFQLHKSVGLTILLLVGVRLMWRFTHPAPMLPGHMPRWQKAGAHVSHVMLYVLMFSMPLSGWAMSDAAGYHPSWFGLLVPQLIGYNPEAAQLLNQAHGIGANLLWVLLAAHVGAALLHHLWYRDKTLLRMLPASWSKHIPQPNLQSLINKKR